MEYSIHNEQDISGLERVLIQKKKIVPIPYEHLNDFSQVQIAMFCRKYAIYQYPTIELLEFLKSELGDTNHAIEIGAGNGCFGRNLGIRMTDNYQQAQPDVAQYYQLIGQPAVKYGRDVEKIEAIEAVLKYRPETVLACWVTAKENYAVTYDNPHGVKEWDLFDNGVKKYIHVGNDKTHLVKPILKKIPHKKHYFPWLISRSMSREANSIYIFQP